MANALDALREQYPDFYDEFIRLHNYTQTALDGFLTDEGQEALKYFAAQLKKFATEQETEQSQAEEGIRQEAEALAVLNYDEDRPNGFIPGLRASQIDPSHAEEFEDPFHFNEFFAPQEETVVERLNQIAAMQESEKFAEYAQTPGYTRNNSKIDSSFNAVIDACAMRHLALLSDSEITPKSFNNSRKEEKHRIEVEYYATLYQLCLPEKQAEQMATLEGYAGLIAQIDRLVGQARSQEEIIAKLGIDRSVEDKIKLGGKPVAAQKYLEEMQKIARTTVVVSNVRPLQRWFTKPGIAKGFHTVGKCIDMLQKIENSNAFLSQQTNISLSGNPFFMAYRMILSSRSIHNDLKNFQDFTAFKNTFKTPNLQNMGYKRYCSVEGAVKLEESDYRVLLGCAKYKDYLKLTDDKPQLSEAQFKQIHKLQAQTEFNQNDFNMIKQLALKDTYEEYKAKLKGNAVDEETFLNAQKYALISRTLNYPEYEKKAGTKAVSRSEYNQLRAMTAPARLKNWRLIGAALSNRQTRKEIIAHSGYFIGSLPLVGQVYGLYGMAKNLVSKNAYLSVYNSGKTIVDSVKNLRKKKFKSWHDVTNSWDDIKKIWINANGLLATVGSFSMMESRLTLAYNGAVANVNEFQNSDISLGEHLLNTAASSWQDYKTMMLHRLSLGLASEPKEVNSNISPIQENVSAQQVTSLDDVAVAEMESVGLDGGFAAENINDGSQPEPLSRDDVDTVSGASLDMAVAAAGNEGGVAEMESAGLDGGFAAENINDGSQPEPLSRDDVDTVSGASLDMAVAASGHEGAVAEQNVNNNVQAASLDNTSQTTVATENVTETPPSAATVENDTNAGTSASAVAAENEAGTAAATGATENIAETETVDSAVAADNQAEAETSDSTGAVDGQTEEIGGEGTEAGGEEIPAETAENIVPVTSQISQHDGKYAITIGDNEPVNFHFEKGSDHIWHMILEPGDNIENLANIDNEEAAKQVYEHFKDEEHLPRPLRKFMEDYQELHAAQLVEKSAPPSVAEQEQISENKTVTAEDEKADLAAATLDDSHNTAAAQDHTTAGTEKEEAQPAATTEVAHAEPEIVAKGHVHHNQFVAGRYTVNEEGEIAFKPGHFCKCDPALLDVVRESSTGNLQEGMSFLNGNFHADDFGTSRMQQEEVARQITLTYAAVHDMEVKAAAGGILTEGEKLSIQNFHQSLHQMGLTVNENGEWKYDPQHHPESVAENAAHQPQAATVAAEAAPAFSSAKVEINGLDVHCQIDRDGNLTTGANWQSIRNDTSILNAIRHSAMQEPGYSFCNGKFNDCSFQDYRFHQEQIAAQLTIQQEVLDTLEARVGHGGQLNVNERKFIDNFYRDAAEMGLTVDKSGHWSYVGDKAQLIEHPYGYAATAAAAEQTATIEHNTPKLGDKPTEQPRVEEAPSKTPAAEQTATIEHNTPKLGDKPTEQPRVEEAPSKTPAAEQTATIEHNTPKFDDKPTEQPRVEEVSSDEQKAGESREEKAETVVASEHPEGNNANESDIPVHKIDNLYYHGTYQLGENEDGTSYHIEFNGAVHTDPLISRQLREVLQANYDATGKYSLGGAAYENFDAAMLGMSEQAKALTKMNAVAEDLMARQGNGETLSVTEQKFLEYADQKNDLYTQKEYYKNGAVKSEVDVRGGITEYKRNGTISSQMTGQEVFIARGNEYRAQRSGR